MIFCSNSVYDPICLHALSKINTNLIDWLFDFSNLIIHTNFLCDRPLPELHDMLDPTLKVSVNYNREREREEREKRGERERGERERESIHSHIYLILVLEERKNFVSSEKKNSWMATSTQEMSGKLYF